MKLLQRLFVPPLRSSRSPQVSQLNAGPFEVTLTRKAVRTLRIRLGRDGQVLATAPWRMADAPIKAFVLEHTAWIEKHRVKVLAERNALQRAAEERASLAPEIRRAQERQQRKALLATAEALRPQWEKAMGVKAESLRIRSMRSRWGSCNPRSKVITLALALHSQEVALVELILVHELAHLRVRSHNTQFKAILTEHLPDWRQRWKRLKAPSRPA